MAEATKRRYRPTESKYKGGAEEMYVTYDLAQETRGGKRAIYPKVQRLYIAGDVKGWDIGTFAKRSGRKVHGVKVDYVQARGRYARQGFTAHRGGTKYEVSPARVGGSTSAFSKIVEVPQQARNVRFRRGKLPGRYRQALQDVR